MLNSPPMSRRRRPLILGSRVTALAIAGILLMAPLASAATYNVQWIYFQQVYSGFNQCAGAQNRFSNDAPGTAEYFAVNYSFAYQGFSCNTPFNLPRPWIGANGNFQRLDAGAWVTVSTYSTVYNSNMSWFAGGQSRYLHTSSNHSHRWVTGHTVAIAGGYQNTLHASSGMNP